MALLRFDDLHRWGWSTPNRERPSCGFANDSWEPVAVGWWGGEP
ncbi:hypothetical protein [Brevibacterium sp. JSBI002]|nr:hypothetical protein [Brevibacterium sp. JSBI002]UZD62787.1 hypothetical protein LJ362_02655 [Brevibacterium sp. JSBI002]